MAQPSKQKAASVLDSVAGWRPFSSTPQTKPRRAGLSRPNRGAPPRANVSKWSRHECRVKLVFVTPITAWNERLDDIDGVGGTNHESNCSFNSCIRYHCRERNSHRAEYPCAAGHHRRRVCWAQLLAGHAADQAQITIPRDASAGLVSQTA